MILKEKMRIKLKKAARQNGKETKPFFSD